MPISAINFNSRNFVKVVAGAKRTTIRLGDKTYSVGICAFMCDGVPVDNVGEITEIRKVRFGALGLSDAVEHGYNNLDELKAELESCYQRSIHASDVITIVRFEMDGEQ